jgi:hypothetical protein
MPPHRTTARPASAAIDGASATATSICAAAPATPRNSALTIVFVPQEGRLLAYQVN